MKVLIQRVKRASVTISGELYSKIGHGLLVFVGIEKGDTEETVLKLAEKTLNLRIFEDENGKMNKSVKDVEGEILSVSQFTLAGNCKKGTRPSFDNAEKPDLAKKMYELYNSKLEEQISVKTGVFAAMMDVELINDGPVTFMLDLI
ncbi:D-tyrosyl-tRNA(Tyr) deacylase [bacterium]|nr:D-tyrosyl-tRNA(Tyr) deacylase [bacterium]